MMASCYRPAEPASHAVCHNAIRRDVRNATTKMCGGSPCRQAEAMLNEAGGRNHARRSCYQLDIATPRHAWNGEDMF